MQALLLGGTGLISVGIVKHLLARGAAVTVFNRAKRPDSLPAGVHRVVGDRNNSEQLEKLAAGRRFDVIIDMICFDPTQAKAAVDAFGGKTEHFIFCSTVCTYGVKVPEKIFVDENFPQEPISGYGKNKVACEKIFLAAHDAGQFKTTVIRPSHTYGPGSPMIDNLEPDAVAWDRIERGLPVLCAADGLGLWVSTHRDDCGKLFAHAAMNPIAFGECYNATRDQHLTWRQYYGHVAAALGKPAKLIFMPADWIVKHDPRRFNLLKEITAFHGVYDSSKAKRHIAQFRCDIGLTQGAAETFADIRRRNAWKSSENDGLYQSMIDAVRANGAAVVEA